MCFTNLPVEFDEDGNPYLDEEEADEVEHADCGCAHDAEGALDKANPQEAYNEIMEQMPEDVKQHLADPGGVVESGPKEVKSD